MRRVFQPARRLGHRRSIEGRFYIVMTAPEAGISENLREEEKKSFGPIELWALNNSPCAVSTSIEFRRAKSKIRKRQFSRHND